jgi:hypothetical protein
VFVLSLACVFLILAALYESWSLPFSVLLSVPIAIFGALTGLLLRGFPLDVYGQIGLVMLIGLAAKNAILIIEFAKGELEQGRPLVEAALAGAKLRFRPVLMTSFAFVFGLLPLWIASGAGDGGHHRHAGRDRDRDLHHPTAVRTRGTPERSAEGTRRGTPTGPGRRPAGRRYAGIVSRPWHTGRP